MGGIIQRLPSNRSEKGILTQCSEQARQCSALAEPVILQWHCHGTGGVPHCGGHGLWAAGWLAGWIPARPLHFCVAREESRDLGALFLIWRAELILPITHIFLRIRYKVACGPGEWKAGQQIGHHKQSNQRKKTDQLDFHQNETLLGSGHHQERERQPIEWKKIGVSHISDKGLEYRKNSYNSIIKRQIILLKERQRVWIDISPRKIYKCK